MDRSDLAEQLLAAGSVARMRRRLKDYPELSDASLANEIKDICYAAWASEPTVAQKTARAIQALEAVSPRPEILAIESWIAGIADITLGRLESAAANLGRASALFKQLKNEHQSAQPMVARLIALAMLGRYDEAVKAGKKALGIFAKYGDELAAGKVEMNLSNVVSRREQHRQAEKFCFSAHARFVKLNEKSWQAMAENGLANTHAELNDFRRAEVFYSRALKTAREVKMEVTEAEILASMGNLAMFRGRYGEALKLLEQSRQKNESLGMPHQTAVAELEMADIYAELNLFSDAEELYRSALTTLRRLKLKAEEARGRMNLGKAALSLGKISAGRKELSKAASLFEAERNEVGMSAVKLVQARLEISAGSPDKALTLADESAARLRRSENRRQYLSALWVRGASLAALGRPAAARQIFRRTLAGSLEIEQSSIARESLNSLGKLSVSVRQAEDFYKRAIKLTENGRRPLPGEEFRMAFLADKLEPYENLAKLYLSKNRIEDAFSVVESSRSKSLLETAHERSTVPSTDDPLANEARDLREELNWLYSRLDRGEGNASKLETAARKREKEISTLLRRIRSTEARRSSNTAANEAKFDVAELRKFVGPDRVLIEFVNFGGSFSAFVVTDRTIEYFARLAREDDIAQAVEGLHFQFGTLRYGGALRGFARQLKDRTDNQLARLYSLLLRPLSDHLNTRELIVVPAGNLNLVPFHALHDGDKYIVESREVSYAPSAAIWQKLNRTPGREIKKALLMGFADERIPLVEREIEMLHKIFPSAKVFTGGDATFSSFTGNAAGRDIIHLGCHGRFRPDNPMYSSLHLADGWVTVRDVTETEIDAELVTLSACETGLNKIHAGDEILGLARGFLSAGAKRLVLSLWPVNDEATMLLMREFYTNLQRGRTVAASLRLAQNAFITRGEHPFYWAPFVSIG